MFELSRHIEILLLNNDCVIVPNFGGFLTHYVSARFEVEENLFLPPARTIGFNPQLKLNDHLLIQSYVEAYDISYPEALRRIESEVEEMRQHLANEGSYELNDLGVLHINEDGNYEFTPCEAGILTPELYGFSSFEIAPLQKPVETVNTVVSDTIIDKTNAEDSTEQTIVSPIETADDAANNAIVVKMSWIRNMVATAVAVLLFFVITTPIDNSESKSAIQQSSFLSVSLSESRPSEEVEKPIATDIKTQTATDNSIKATDVHKTGNKKTVVTSTSPVANYTICLASRTTRFHAETFVTKLKNSGVSDVRIINMYNSDKVRVVCGAFATSEDAHNVLREYRASQKEFREAWVLNINK